MLLPLEYHLSSVPNKLAGKYLRFGRTTLCLLKLVGVTEVFGRSAHFSRKYASHGYESSCVRVPGCYFTFYKGRAVKNGTCPAIHGLQTCSPWGG